MLDQSAEGTARSALDLVFRALAHHGDLHRNYVLKGGLALYLFYGSPRRSTDLDFNAAEPTANTLTEESRETLLQFCRDLDSAAREMLSGSEFDVVMTGDVTISTEIPTLLGQIVYMAADGASGAIPMQLTLSEIICASEIRKTRDIPVHVASLEDIIAEKLKAILQQVPRDTVRSSDIYDVWFFTSRSTNRVSPEGVTSILLEKRKQWPAMPVVTKGRYEMSDVRRYSAADYEKIVDDLDSAGEFVPFDDAYSGMLDFIRKLQLPD